MQKGDFLGECFKLALYKVSLFYIDAFSEAATKSQIMKYPHILWGIHWNRSLDLNLNY
jgi:hypothetical protein